MLHTYVRSRQEAIEGPLVHRLPLLVPVKRQAENY